MKKFNNLWHRVISWENLVCASIKAGKGKRYCYSVSHFENNREYELLKIQNELINHSYSPGSYRQFTIYENKPRIISAAPYRDRVVHHALCNVIEPLFDKTFIYDSYACRLGKGTHKAADRYTEFSRKNRYVLKWDISKYFPSIDHTILYEELTHKINDKDVLWLIRVILGSQGDEGLLWPSGKGIPIGNLTSQFFANVYLNRFDHWMKEEMGCQYYIRYVDDVVILSNDKSWLGSLVRSIIDKLDELALKVHPRKCQVFKVIEGCDFMGYRIFPEHRLLRKNNGYRFARKWEKMGKCFNEGSIDLKNVRDSLMSWIGHASHADTWGLRNVLIPHVVF